MSGRPKLPIPGTLEEIEAAGYGYTGQSKICSCGSKIFWFLTPPREGASRGKWMPFSALKDSRLVPHHNVCQRVKDFRAANKAHAARTERPKPVQKELFS